jgi:hypothetical protein
MSTPHAPASAPSRWEAVAARRRAVRELPEARQSEALWRLIVEDLGPLVTRTSRHPTLGAFILDDDDRRQIAYMAVYEGLRRWDPDRGMRALPILCQWSWMILTRRESRDGVVIPGATRLATIRRAKARSRQGATGADTVGLDEAVTEQQLGYGYGLTTGARSVDPVERADDAYNVLDHTAVPEHPVPIEERVDLARILNGVAGFPGAALYVECWIAVRIGGQTLTTVMAQAKCSREWVRQMVRAVDQWIIETYKESP